MDIPGHNHFFLFCISLVCAVDSTQEEAEEDTEDINGPDIVDAGTYMGR